VDNERPALWPRKGDILNIFGKRGPDLDVLLTLGVILDLPRTSPG
jgi:hypothetical protein